MISRPIINPKSGELEHVKLNTLDECHLLAKQDIIHGDDALLVDGIRRTDPAATDTSPADILQRWQDWQARNWAMSNMATAADKMEGCPFPTFLESIRSKGR